MSAERRRRGIFCRCLFQYTFGRVLWQSVCIWVFAVVLSATGAVLSLIQSYIGYLSNKTGPRLLVIGGGAVSALGFLLIGLTYSKTLLIPLYLMMNVGMGILVPSVFTMMSYQRTADGDSFIPAYRSIQGIGVILGPVAGGWLMGHSYRANVILGGLLMAFATALFAACFMGQENRASIHGQDKKSEMTFKGAIAEIFHNKTFLLVMGLFACVELSYDLIRISLPMTGAELNFSTEIIGTSLSAYYIVFTLFQIPVNNALKKIKRRSALMIMGALSLIPCGMLLLDIPSHFLVFIMGGVGLTIGCLFTFCTVLASEESPEDKKGTFLGIFNTIMPFTDIVSPVAAAFMLLFIILSRFGGSYVRKK